MKNKHIILGAGMTGLAAGFSSGLPVYESSDIAGGICSSYYMLPGETIRYSTPPKGNAAYRFETGGGHWIFGGDAAILQFLKRFVTLKQYNRSSSVYFNNKNLFVPYPLQNHLRYLDHDITSRAIAEMKSPSISSRTMKDWLVNNFGPTLCNLFFYPFHKLYTAGLYKKIAPQDSYKSPVDISSVIQGALNKTSPTGYNTTFVYPEEGLDGLAQGVAAHCDIKYNKKVTSIFPKTREIKFSDGDRISYDKIISTLPLNNILKLASITDMQKDDPYSSVLVLNIGAERGNNVTSDHWLYTPDSVSGFHRVGFYSNVDKSFLPANSKNKASIYVERAFKGNDKPSKEVIERYTHNVVSELQDWGFIKKTDIIDSTWIDVAYTWSWPGSNWIKSAIEKLEYYGIYQAGRYGQWKFQGIADSISDGLHIGSTVKPLIKKFN